MAKTIPKKGKPLIYDKILKSATTEFAAKGFAGARMDEIARQAKINKARTAPFRFRGDRQRRS